MISHALSRRERIIIVPDVVDEEAARHFSEEFEIWIVANGLRELIDTLSNFLTELHIANSLVLGKVQPQGLTRFRTQIDRMSVREQLSETCDQIEHPNEFSPIVETWRKARNCLTHRMGIVERADCDDGAETLTVRWRGLQFVVVEPDGQETILDLDGPEPNVFENGGVAHFRVVEKAATFALGQPIKITGHQLSEICLTVQTLVDQLTQASSNAAVATGVTIGERRADI
jgi:hypothetical protein